MIIFYIIHKGDNMLFDSFGISSTFTVEGRVSLMNRLHRSISSASYLSNERDRIRPLLIKEHI